MISLFSLLLLVIYCLIILAHSWGFWLVYKSKIGEQAGLEMFGRGIVAGLAGWFWLCFGLGIWNLKNAGAWMIFIWIYCIWFVPLIGLALTIIFWWILEKLRWRLAICSRALGGCAAGVIIGWMIGSFSEAQSSANQNMITGMTLLFGTMGLASGIMAGESDD